MKLKTIIVATVIVATAGYGGTKTYIYLKAKSKLDSLVQMASPFVEISYGGISSNLSGSLTVTNLDLNSVTGGETLQVGSVELKGPGPGFLLDLTGGFKNGDLPLSMSLNLQRLSVPVDQGFGTYFSANGMSGGSEIASQAEPCTLSGIFQHKGLEAMGVETLTADATFGYRIDQSGGEVRAFFDYQMDGMESFSLELDLSGMPDPGGVIMGSLPSLGNLDLQYEVEPGYMKRMVEHCSKLASQSPELYIETLFNQEDKHFARNLGFIPGPGIRAVLKSLTSRGGQIQLTAKPTMKLDPMTLAAYRPEDMLDMLGLELTLNNKPVKDLSIKLPFDETASSWMSEFRSMAQDQDSMAPGIGIDSELNSSLTEPTRARRSKPQFLETEVTDLHKYIGKQVRLYTGKAKKPQQGYLVSSKGEVISVKQNVHRGSMTAHLSMAKISKAEVLRRATGQP